MSNICQTADKQLFALVEWAKRIPHFSELPLEDQVILLRAGTIQRQGKPSRAAPAAKAAALTFHLADGHPAAAVKSLKWKCPILFYGRMLKKKRSLTKVDSIVSSY